RPRASLTELRRLLEVVAGANAQLTRDGDLLEIAPSVAPPEEILFTELVSAAALQLVVGLAEIEELRVDRLHLVTPVVHVVGILVAADTKVQRRIEVVAHRREVVHIECRKIAEIRIRRALRLLEQVEILDVDRAPIGGEERPARRGQAAAVVDRL